MKRRLLIALVGTVFIFAGPAAGASDDFDYSDTQYIYAIMDSEAIAYARFPVFKSFRSLITDRMSNSDASLETSGDVLYTLHLLGIGEETTLSVGNGWISDGENAARLSEDDLEWIESAINHRIGTGMPADRLESHLAHHLEQQKDPAWTPE